MLDFLSALSQALPALGEMSLTAAYAAAIVIVLRLLLKRRAPKQVLCLLWLVVFARLLVPASLESPLSIVPSALPGQTQAQPSGKTPAIPGDAGQAAPQQGQGTLQAVGVGPAPVIPAGGSAPALTVPDGAAPAVPNPGPAPFPWRPVLAGVWLAGALAMGGWGLASYFRLRRRLFDAVRADDGAWEHPSVSSPFILGLFRPRIFLPMGLEGQPRQFILCHERAHLRRLDHIVKPVCWAALALHWFNPAAWAAYILMSRDIEAACDEAVLRRLGDGVKADYSYTLLALAANRRAPAPCPLAFDEGDAKGRIQNVLRYRRPALWIIVVSVIAAALAAVCLLTDPVAAKEPDADPSPGASASQPPDTSLNALLDPWMKEVLDGERQFARGGDMETEQFSIHQLRDMVYRDEHPDLILEVGKLAVMDLDRDGVNEMVVWPAGGAPDDTTEIGYTVGYFIFYRQEDKVKVHYIGWRPMQNLKADGTFEWSSSAWSSGVSRFIDIDTFETEGFIWCDNPNDGDENYFVDGERATAWDFESAMTAQLQKSEPVWYTYENGALSRIPPAIPLDAYVLSAPVPDFLDGEQQQLYRQAYALYHGLFPAANDGDHFPGQGVPEPAGPVERQGVSYAPENGCFARWDDFERAVLSVFTQDAWDAKNTSDNIPVYIGVDNRTYYIPYGRSGGEYNGRFPETFRLVSQTDDTIEFVMTGYYTNWAELPGETHEEWQARQEEWEYSIDFPMRLVKTENGWRFDQFYLAVTDDFGTPGLPRTPNPNARDTIPTPMEIATAAPLDAPVLGWNSVLPEDPRAWYKVAELPDDLIWVFSRNYGQETLIRWDGNFYKAFDHVAHTPHLDMPQLKKLGGPDAYGPLAVISEVNSGSGCFGQELVVYDLDGPAPVDYTHNWRPLMRVFNNTFSYQYDDRTRVLTLSYQGQTITKTLIDLVGDDITALSITGEQVRYSFDETNDGRFRLSLGVQAFAGGNVTSLFPVDVSWTLQFNGGGFDVVPGSCVLS